SETEEDCITPRQSTTISLRYPSIPVTGTPDSWLSNSLLVPMASNHEEGSVRSTDDTMSSLDGSTYDFVDDTSYGTTDDEDQSRMTESVSVISDAPDEPASSPDLERTLSSASLPHLSASESAQNNSHGSERVSASQQKELRVGLSSPGDQHKHQQHECQTRKLSEPVNIRFQHSSHQEGIHRVESPRLPDNLALTVRQHMLSSIPSFGSTYRLLYIGDETAKVQIVAKIASAIAATEDRQSSNGRTSQPGTYLDVRHCVQASFGRINDGHDTIQLSLNDGPPMYSAWDGSRFTLTARHGRPDLAIFYLSEHDSVSIKQTRRFTRSLAARHRIPSIVVNDRTPWLIQSETRAVITIDHLTPHFCLQTAKEVEAQSRILKRLPIDLPTYLRIDELQLAQNLGYLARQYPESPSASSQAPTPMDQPKPTSDKKTDSTPALDARRRLRQILGPASLGLPWLLNLLAVVTICMAAGVLMRQRVTPFGRPHHEVSSIHTVSSSASSFAPTATVTSIPSLRGQATVQSLVVQDAVKAKTPPRSLMVKSNTDLIALMLEAAHPTVNKSEHFKVQILGEAHLIMRPPHWFTKLKKTPKLKFRVTQGNQVLGHQVSALFDGVYALELFHDEAHGPVNITVWTESRPRIHESLQADFGNSWLHTASWRKAANALSTSFRKDLDLMQTSLTAGYSHSGVQLRSLMRKASTEVDKLRVVTRTAEKAYATRLAQIMHLAFAHEQRFSLRSLRGFQEKKTEAAKAMSRRVVQFQRRFSGYVSNKIRQAHVYTDAAPTAYRIHLRGLQKKALKVWWGINGLPDQRRAWEKPNSRLRACDGKAKKRAGVR
ncbi:MAG: hypothetical protein Q9183_001680, partial [Haloplaca sp. 2 TL-2023]